MSTLTTDKKKLINWIISTTSILEIDLKDFDFDSLNAMTILELERLGEKLLYKLYLRMLPQEDLDRIVTTRLDGCLGRQRGKGVIVEAMRRIRIQAVEN